MNTTEDISACKKSRSVGADDILSKAVAYAAKCHAGQLRKGSAMPYIIHPMEAATICASFTDSLTVSNSAR